MAFRCRCDPERTRGYTRLVHPNLLVRTLRPRYWDDNTRTIDPTHHVQVTGRTNKPRGTMLLGRPHDPAIPHAVQGGLSQLPT